MVDQEHKRVLITGGLGFIGSYLIDALAADVAVSKIVVIDSLESNVIRPEAARMTSEKCTVYEQTIEDTDFECEEFDLLYHLASPVGPVGVLKHAGDMAERMICDSVKVRNACLVKGIPLVFVSSSEIYGHNGRLREDSIKTFPGEYAVRTEYGAAKMLGEMTIVNKAKVTDLKYLVIRPFNVAGPRQLPDNGFVLPRFIRSALNGEDLTVYNDGTQRRAFTDVRDIVSSIQHIVRFGEWNSVWNIGNPSNEMSIEELANKVLRFVRGMGIVTKSGITHVDPKTLHGPLYEEVPDKIPHVEKLYAAGWVPKLSFKDTITDTINYVLKGEC